MWMCDCHWDTCTVHTSHLSWKYFWWSYTFRCINSILIQCNHIHCTSHFMISRSRGYYIWCCLTFITKEIYLQFSVSFPIITLCVHFVLYSPINSLDKWHIIGAQAGFAYLYSNTSMYLIVQLLKTTGIYPVNNKESFFIHMYYEVIISGVVKSIILLDLIMPQLKLITS